jgi:hypothetical protein
VHVGRAGIYRREGWEVPLGAALLELRECAARLKLPEVGGAPLPSPARTSTAPTRQSCAAAGPVLVLLHDMYSCILGGTAVRWCADPQDRDGRMPVHAKSASKLEALKLTLLRRSTRAARWSWPRCGAAWMQSSAQAWRAPRLQPCAAPLLAAPRPRRLQRAPCAQAGSTMHHT